MLTAHNLIFIIINTIVKKKEIQEIESQKSRFGSANVV